jgi:hypothetical protein
MELPSHLRQRLDAFPKSVHGVGPEHVLGSTWRATRDLDLVSWHGGDRLGMCQYGRRVSLPAAGLAPHGLRAGTRLRLTAAYDADHEARTAGINDVVEFYAYCDSADHLTFEVIDGDLAGQIVQARLDPIGDPDATTAAAAIVLEST